MKRHRSQAMAIVSCVFALAACASAQDAQRAETAKTGAAYTDFRVTPTAVNGTYANVQQALDAAVELRRRAPEAAIRIRIAAGDYYLSSPLRIDRLLSGTPQAPTEISAEAGAAPRLLAGQRLDLRWQAAADGLYRASVGDANFDQLFVNDQLQVRARYPNFDPKSVLGGYAEDTLSAARTARWKNPEGGIVHALHQGRWGDMRIPILGRKADGSLEFGPAVGNNRPSPPHATYRSVENIFEELDAPGEWYLDRSKGTLYYRPDSGIALDRAKVEISGSKRILDLQGADKAPLHDVLVAGLKLTHTGYSYLDDTESLLRSDWSISREAAIHLENTENVSIVDNELSQLGGNAIFASGYNRQLKISGNYIHAIGAGAINLVGRPEAVRSPSFGYEQAVDFSGMDREPGPRTSAYPSDSLIQDNLVHDIGLAQKQVAGVQLSMAMNITVSHNTIYDVPRAGINIGEGAWGGHVIEYNDVFNTVLETSDHGAFNSWGRDRFWHPDRQRMNRLNEDNPGLWKLDVLKPIVLRNNRFHCEHGWDIDLDDGSSGYRIHDNVLLSGGLKFREGFDRRAWNNILVNNGFHPHVWFKNSGDRFERNIVMASHQPILMEHWDGAIDYNLLPTKRALQQAQALGLDKHSQAGDPKFLDAKHGDYRVAEGSPALALGFKNFPMDNFGVTSARLKALMQKHAPTPALVFADAAAPGQEFEWLGARIKSVTTLGERSAAGLSETRGVLVLQVASSSLAAASGLKAGDVIVEATADPFSPKEQIDDAPALMSLYSARRWRGSQEVIVIRNQKPLPLQLRFTKE